MDDDREGPETDLVDDLDPDDLFHAMRTTADAAAEVLGAFRPVDVPLLQEWLTAQRATAIMESVNQARTLVMESGVRSLYLSFHATLTDQYAPEVPAPLQSLTDHLLHAAILAAALVHPADRALAERLVLPLEEIEWLLASARSATSAHDFVVCLLEEWTGTVHDLGVAAAAAGFEQVVPYPASPRWISDRSR